MPASFKWETSIRIPILSISSTKLFPVSVSPLTMSGILGLPGAIAGLGYPSSFAKFHVRVDILTPLSYSVYRFSSFPSYTPPSSTVIIADSFPILAFSSILSAVVTCPMISGYSAICVFQKSTSPNTCVNGDSPLFFNAPRWVKREKHWQIYPPSLIRFKSILPELERREVSFPSLKSEYILGIVSQCRSITRYI